MVNPETKLQTTAIPYNILEKSQKSTSGKAHEFLSAHILYEENAICTRSFLIRFVTDQIPLNDLGFFRLELDNALETQWEVYL